MCCDPTAVKYSHMVKKERKPSENFDNTIHSVILRHSVSSAGCNGVMIMWSWACTLETRLFLACNAFATKKQDEGQDIICLLVWTYFLHKSKYHICTLWSYKDIYFDTLVDTVVRSRKLTSKFITIQSHILLFFSIFMKYPWKPPRR